MSDVKRMEKSGMAMGNDEVRSFIQEQSPLRDSAPTVRFTPMPSIEQHEAVLFPFDRYLPCPLRALAPLPSCPDHEFS